MDKIEMLSGDAINELQRIPPESVDLVIADPPYNLSKDYKSTHDSMGFNDFQTFTLKWLTQVDRVLRPGGTIYVFMGMRMIAYTYSLLERQLGYNFENWITWHYTQGVGKKKGFSSRHDDILCFSKPGSAVIFNIDEIRVPQKYYRSINNMRGANPGNVWDFSHIHYSQKGRMQHPTQKPEGVIERMVLASSAVHDTVLDPFFGSGTTLRVCQQLQRSVIGIEIENDFVEESKERLSHPFLGFDSIDERMLRVPNDLNDSNVRQKYFPNHIQWFLRNHNSSIEQFINDFVKKYSSKISPEEFNYIENIAHEYGIQKVSRSIKVNSNLSLFQQGKEGSKKILDKA